MAVRVAIPVAVRIPSTTMVQANTTKSTMLSQIAPQQTLKASPSMALPIPSTTTVPSKTAMPTVKPRFDTSAVVSQTATKDIGINALTKLVTEQKIPTPIVGGKQSGGPAMPLGDAPNVPQPAEQPYADDAQWEEFAEASEPVPQRQEVRDELLVKSASGSPTVAATPKLVQPSWFDRLLAVFGLSRKAVQGTQMAGEAAGMAGMTQQEAAHTLVRRARNGDQNAMAIIAMVRDNAKAGVVQAVLTAKLMKQYIDTHPVTAETLDMGYDDMIPGSPRKPEGDQSKAASVALSHGPALTADKIEAVLTAARFGKEERAAFAHGFAGRAMRNPNQRIQHANKFGQTVGHARRLQQMKNSEVPISKHAPMIGWELGEDE